MTEENLKKDTKLPEEDPSKEKRREFLLSKIGDTITRVSDFNLIAYFTSTLIGLSAIFLAVGAILPTQYLDLDRLWLLFATVVVIGIMVIVQQLYLDTRREKLALLKNWHLEVFLNKARIDSLSHDKFKELIRLIDSVEDRDFFKKVKDLNDKFQEIMKGEQQNQQPGGSSPVGSSENPVRSYKMSGSKKIQFIILFGLLVAGIYLVFLGNSLVQQYDDAPITISEMKFQGIGLEWTNAFGRFNGGTPALLNDTIFSFVLDVPQRYVVLDIQFHYISLLNHTFGFILPFPVSKNLSESTCENSPEGNLTDSQSHNLTASSSIVLFTFVPTYNSTQYSDTYVDCQFETGVYGNLVSDNRGQYQLYIPTGIVPSGQTINASTKYVSSMSYLSNDGYHLLVYLGVDGNVDVENSFPSFGSLAETAYFGIDEQQMFWNFSPPYYNSPITLTFTNSTEVQNYSSELFGGGLWLGVGVSALFASITDITAEGVSEYQKCKKGNGVETPD